MTSGTPTIVLVPSSFCPSALLWDKTIDLLSKAGYNTIAVELPSVSPPSTAPAKTMLDDAAHIHGIVESLANDGKDVLLVTHSYGGIPGTQSVNGLSRKERSEQGKEGGVTGLVYITSLLVNEGENSQDSFAPFSSKPPDFFRPSGEYLYLDPIGAAAAIFAELPKDQGEAWTRKMSGQAMAALQERMTSTSHYDIPITYVKCTSDKVNLLAHQQKMIDDIRGVTRSSVEVVEMACGHCPMVVNVERTAEVILGVVKKQYCSSKE